MAWVYLDDQFPDHPKVVRAGAEAAWMYVCGLAYSKRYGTHGVIPVDQVPKLTTFRGAARLADRLVAERLWEKTPDGFVVHDYDDWNRKSESRSEAGRKAAHARWHAKRNANADAEADAAAPEPHLPHDALSLSHNPNPEDLDLGCELTDLESVSNVPPDSGHENREISNETLVAKLVRAMEMPS